MTYPATVLADSPDAYWRFGEAAGVTAEDETANNKDLSYVASPTLGAGGAIDDGNTAVTFNGSTQLAERTTPISLLANGWSLEAWVKSANLNQAGCIISNGSDARGMSFLQAKSDGSGGTGARLMVLRNGTGWIDTGWDFPETTNWHHIVITCDGSDITRAYVDGSLVFTSSALAYTASFADHHTTVGAMYQGDNSTKQRFFAGSIDEPAIYDSVLSPTRITAHYTASVTPLVPTASTAGGVLTLSGPGLATELVEDNTYYGKNISGDVATQLASLLVAQPQPWTPVVEGVPTQPNFRADGMSIWAVIQQMAQVAGGYVRDNPTLRRLDFKTGHADSGIRLRNVEMVDPAITDAIVTRLTGYREDASGVVNRVVPFGAGTEDLIFDLQQSDRSSPYAIQYLTPALPDLSSPIRLAPSYLLDGYQTTARTVKFNAGGQYALDFLRFGRHRMLFVTAHSNVNLTPTAIRAGGQPMVLYQAYTAGTDRALSLWYLQNPAAGDATLPIEVDLPAEGTGTKDIVLLVVAMNDVDLYSPTQGQASASGTSSSAAVTITGTGVDEMILAALSDPTTGAAGSVGVSGGWTDIVDTVGGAGANMFLAQAGNGGSLTCTLSLPASQTWLMGIWRLRAARNYYIEDATSIAAYRRRTAIIQAKDIHQTNNPVADANALYDFASTYLLRSRNPLIVYGDTDPVNLPRGSWLVGDTLHLDYRGLVEKDTGTVKPLEVDADVIVTARTQMFDQDGVRRWKLTLANGLKRPPDIVDLLQAANQLQRLPAL